MLGSVADAEDIVQNAYLRFRNAQGVENESAYLTTIVTRLCIDHLRSARVRREEYVGPWLPEPWLANEAGADGERDGSTRLMLAESLSTAFLVLLERLNPVERAVYLLREVFDYEYAEIAAIVGKSEANCRQVASRAKRYIAERRPRFEPDRDRERSLTEQFLKTIQSGDMEGLLSMLAEDVVVYSDGGGKAFAAKKPVVGIDLVARFLFGITKNAPEGLEVRFARSNGLPAVVSYVNKKPLSVMALHVVDGRVQSLFAVLNPEKLNNVPALP